MSLWSDLPDFVKESGALDSLEPFLDAIDTPGSTDITEGENHWRVYDAFTLGDDTPLSLNPSTGRFNRGPGSGKTPIEFPDPSVSIVLRLHLDGPSGSPDGRFQLITETPTAIVRLPFLRGAKLDTKGQLQEDSAHPDVKFHLPALRIRTEVLISGDTSVKILSASTRATSQDEIYEFVRMEPAYALIGPGNVVGFAFRTAILDLSGDSGPAGIPNDAFALPSEWQGFYLPEARVFVAPQGMEGLAVSAGVRNLWIGMAEHAGVTGTFEVDIVQRGAAPSIRLRFQTFTGEWIGVDAAETGTIELPENTRLYVDAAGGLAPYTYQLSIGDNTPVSTDRVDVVTPVSGTLSINVSVTDAESHASTRSFTVRRRANAIESDSPTGARPVVLTSMPPSNFSRIRLISQSAESATLELEPAFGAVSWTWGETNSASGDNVTVSVAEGESVTVVATRQISTTINCYTLFDKPHHNSYPKRIADFAEDAKSTRTEAAARRKHWSDGVPFLNPESTARFSQYPNGTKWKVEGFASYENRDDASTRTRNQNLSERRREVLIHIPTCQPSPIQSFVGIT